MTGAGDFIGVYPGLLAPERCREITARFDASGLATAGRVGGGVLPELKHSRDIQLNQHADWLAVEKELNTAMFRALLAYVREYPYALIAPLLLQRQLPDGTVTRYGHDDIRALDDRALAELLRAVFRPGPVNLQRYEADEGGYPYWHSEHYPRDDDSLHRVLLWTVYLNDGFGAGETEFVHQNRKITPRAGSLLIAPAGFTHTHRGNRPTGGAKYIGTSWILFQRAETLYGRR
ncbi:MAG: 2OG-Fe(II) oxygenase [Arenimonas sp.]